MAICPMHEQQGVCGWMPHPRFPGPGMGVRKTHVVFFRIPSFPYQSPNIATNRSRKQKSQMHPTKKIWRDCPVTTQNNITNHLTVDNWMGSRTIQLPKPVGVGKMWVSKISPHAKIWLPLCCNWQLLPRGPRCGPICEKQALNPLKRRKKTSQTTHISWKKPQKQDSFRSEDTSHATKKTNGAFILIAVQKKNETCNLGGSVFHEGMRHKKISKHQQKLQSRNYGENIWPVDRIGGNWTKWFHVPTPGNPPKELKLGAPPEDGRPPGPRARSTGRGWGSEVKITLRGASNGRESKLMAQQNEWIAQNDTIRAKCDL